MIFIIFFGSRIFVAKLVIKLVRVMSPSFCKTIFRYLKKCSLAVRSKKHKKNAPLMYSTLSKSCAADGRFTGVFFVLVFKVTGENFIHTENLISKTFPEL